MRLKTGIILAAIAGGIVAAAMRVQNAGEPWARGTPDDLPRTAVVFTGAFERIHSGLDLLAAGRVDRLFVSGVNARAGLDPRHFAEQFGLPEAQVRLISSGQIILATDADSTLENALETACWLRRNPDIEAVALVTSANHMARALVALERAIAPVTVTPVATGPEASDFPFRVRAAEYRDFVATWAITILPPDLWPVAQPSICAGNALLPPSQE